VEFYRAQEDYAVIRAPFAGKVIAKRAHVGEAVSPFGSPGQGSTTGGAIVTLVDFSTLYVGVDVNESNLERLKREQPAEILLDAYPDHPYHGHLLQVIPTADRSKGTVKVKVAFDDLDDRVLPDMSARVNFTEKPTEGVARKHVMIPKSAIRTQGGQAGVLQIVDGRVRFVPVRTGRENQGLVEVEQGLSGGETLVAEAASSGVRDGERVKLKEE
jgi:HlyD family secretion protein